MREMSVESLRLAISNMKPLCLVLSTKKISLPCQ